MNEYTSINSDHRGERRKKCLITVVDQLQAATNNFIITGSVRIPENELRENNCWLFPLDRPDGEDIDLELIDALERVVSERNDGIYVTPDSDELRLEEVDLGYKLLEDSLEITFNPLKRGEDNS